MVVLMYHDIVTATDKSSGFQNKNAFQYKVEETALEEQVKVLQGQDVVFTFDDGGESSFTKAAPILEKYGFKGAFFISTKYIGTQGFLTKEQIIALDAGGHIVGSHSHTHPEIFTKLSKEEIHEEWRKSYEILTDILGEKDIPMSIPNGYASKTILQEAIECGFTDIYTSQPTTLVKSFQKHSVFGRYVVHNNLTSKDVLRIANSKSYRLKMALKWHVLNMVKGALGSSYDTLKAILLHN